MLRACGVSRHECIAGTNRKRLLRLSVYSQIENDNACSVMSFHVRKYLRVHGPVCLFVYGCASVCSGINMCACMWGTHVHVCVCVSVSVRACVYVSARVCVACVYLLACVSEHVSVHACVRMLVCVC